MVRPGIFSTRLYRAAERSPSRRFHALYDKVHRADVLGRAWSEVAANGGASGVDGVSIVQVEEQGVERFLDVLRGELEAGSYRPMPVRRVAIPKASGGTRNLGVPAVRDRVVQAAAKLVCGPIFEADFLDCSYGFRPKRSARQALEAIRVGVNGGRTWVVDADIAGFFDSIPSAVLRSVLEERISDRRMMKLLMGWLRAGVWTGETLIHPETGTAQGGVISPLMANVVLHRLDRRWQQDHRRLGQIVRFADDLVILCPTRERAEEALAMLTEILAGMGLCLAPAKTSLVDLRVAKSGFTFLGFHHRWVESFTRKGRYFLSRWPADRSVARAKDRIRSLTGRRWLRLPVGDVVRHLNRFLVGWRGYFRYGNSTMVFHDLDEFTKERLARFISNKHGHHGRRYGLRVLIGHEYLGLVRLVGSVRHGPVHAVR
ncbi:MAG: group II intron reverse transcriptase/maturase [Nocardioidaceae bacterium]